MEKAVKNVPLCSSRKASETSSMHDSLAFSPTFCEAFLKTFARACGNAILASACYSYQFRYDRVKILHQNAQRFCCFHPNRTTRWIRRTLDRSSLQLREERFNESCSSMVLRALRIAILTPAGYDVAWVATRISGPVKGTTNGLIAFSFVRSTRSPMA